MVVIWIQLFSINRTNKLSAIFATSLQLDSRNCNTGSQETALLDITLNRSKSTNKPISEKSRKDLNGLTAQFDTFKFNDKKFEDIKTSAAVTNQEFQKILFQYQDSLIGYKKNTFEFKESPMEDIFGLVTDIQVYY